MNILVNYTTILGPLAINGHHSFNSIDAATYLEPLEKGYYTEFKTF
jgi:hypothetical protein